MSKALKKVDKKYLFIIGGIFVVIFLIIGIVALFRACTGPGNNYERTATDWARRTVSSSSCAPCSTTKRVSACSPPFTRAGAWLSGWNGRAGRG